MRTILLTLSFLLVSALGSVGLLSAQEDQVDPCIPTTAFIENIDDNGYQVIAEYYSPEGILVVILDPQEDKWAIFLANPTGISCFLMSGEGYHQEHAGELL